MCIALINVKFIIIENNNINKIHIIIMLIMILLLVITIFIIQIVLVDKKNYSCNNKYNRGLQEVEIPQRV